MDEVLNRIIGLLKSKNKNQNELCQYIGISAQVFTDWKGGRNSSYKKHLQKIAEYLDVSVDYLLGTTDIPDRLGKNLRAVEAAPQTMLPVYGFVSAGRGLFADNEIIGYESADCKYGNGEYIWVEVSGDSMSPDIKDGDLVLIKRQTSVDNGDVGIFLVDGENGYIKKVHYSENYIMLESYNPFYPPMEFRGSDVQRVRVIGKVVRLNRKY